VTETCDVQLTENEMERIDKLQFKAYINLKLCTTLCYC